jgi:hypothetical protein
MIRIHEPNTANDNHADEDAAGRLETEDCVVHCDTVLGNYDGSNCTVGYNRQTLIAVTLPYLLIDARGAACSESQQPALTHQMPQGGRIEGST